MNKYCKLTISAIFALILVSCGNHEKPKASQTAAMQTFEVKPQPLHKTLHFTGTIQPLHESTLTSPMEAVVESMDFHYGQMVKKGDVVLTLNHLPELKLGLVLLRNQP